MSRLEFTKHLVEKDDDYPDDIVMWQIHNKKGEYLGFLTDEHWGRWTFEPSEDGIIFSRGCLQEIVDKMKELGGKP
jgi:hypothetical protein